MSNQSKTRYFELIPGAGGFAADGSPEPLHGIGLSAQDEDGNVTKSMVLKPIPGTDIIETTDSYLPVTILGLGMFTEIDKPKEATPKNSKKTEEN